MRRARAILGAAALLAGCSSSPEPPPDPGPVGRAHVIVESRDRAADRAKADREALERHRLGAQDPRESTTRLKRELLDEYGVALTPFQRSALLSSSIATRAEGEAMCRRWIEENRSFERGR